MYISDLELHGFKSFAHKTHVKFDSGITAVVGPNGCGKSNIVDALRWVLGEQRPTLLRSSAMSNVIFNGTAKKKALGMAEVSLTFVNDKGLLPSEYSELTITRRLYRSGDSDYLINDTPVRLKDIVDLFMDTGMSSDAYSVIELKMVEEILNDRNNDRRRMLEEAAGVTRYKEKRKQTLRKLDQTLHDLQRLEDILVEVRKKTRSLELQSKRAEKAKAFREELDVLDKAYQLFAYLGIRREQAPLKLQIETAASKRNELARQLEDLEQKEEKLRTGLIEKERVENDLRRRVQQLSNQKKEKETRSQILHEKIRTEDGVIQQYQSDIEQSEKDRAELGEMLTSNRKKLEQLAKKRESSTQALEESGKRFSDLQKSYSETRRELFESEVAISAKGRMLQDIRSRKIKLESKLESSEDDQKRVHADIERLQKQIEATKAALEDEKKQVVVWSEKIEEAEANLSGVREQRETLQEELNEAREKERQARSKRDAVVSEVELLHHLAASTDAFPEGVAWLIEHHKADFELLVPVSDVIQADESDAVALEAALGEAQNYLIVQSFEDAERAAALLKEEKRGQATFIPLDWVSGGRWDDGFGVRGEGGGVGAEDVRGDGSRVQLFPSASRMIDRTIVDPAFRPVAEILIGHTLWVDEIHTEMLSSGRTFTAVTPTGDLITGGGWFRSGSKSAKTGLRLGLKNKLTKLEKRDLELQHAISQEQKRVESITKKMSLLDEKQVRDSITALQKERRLKDQSVGKLQSGIQIYESTFLELRSHREKLSSSKGESLEELEGLKPKAEKLEKEIDGLRKRESETKKKLQTLEEERAIAQNRYNDAQLAHQDVGNQTSNIEQELKRTEEGIRRVEQRAEQRKKLLEQSKKTIKECREEKNGIAGQMEGLVTEYKEAAETLAEAEKNSTNGRKQIQEQDKELRELRKNREGQLELLHHLTMADEKFDLQSEAITNTVWETYGLVMEQLEKEVKLQEDSFDRETSKERISTLKQKLQRIGEVNPLAIEEYREEKERLDFFEQQMEDLHKAETEMRNTIREINQTATERFNETFQKIRTHFQDVFHRLFEEDDFCDLVLDRESEDPLEAKVEIKANPKGKRPSNISQLSGGEKTLTAIAFLFAIYLVKPSPFCVLDEVDAPLDDANIERFSGMIRSFSEQTQFIIITHNKKTMSKAEMMYGVTMPETGVSRLVGVRLEDVEAGAA